MADENVIGLAMQLDVTDLKSGIKEVNNIIKSSKDEFNNATAGMDKWTKSSEGLKAKLKQLWVQLNAQQKAVAGYEAEIKRVSEMEGDHSTELEVLKGKLLNAQTAVKKTERSMLHYKDVLSDVTKKEKEESSTLGKLQKTIAEQKQKQADLTNEYKNAVLQYGKNSKEAKSLADKIKDLSGEIEDNESKIKNADKAFDGLSKSLADVGEKAAEKAVKGLAKVGAAVTGVVTAFLATAEGTREFRTNMGKVDTAFKDAGFSAKDAEETYKRFYGVLGDEGQATEATALLGELANNQQDLKKWTDISTGVFAKFGDSLPVEGLIEASNETAKTGEIVGGLADALNWAGISQDDFQKKLDKCSNEQERQKLITETLSKTYGDASEAYKETNKDIIASQEAQAQLSQAMADIGAQAEPLMTQVKLLGTKILEAFLPVLEKIIPAIQNNLPLVIAVVGTLTGAIGTLSAAVALLKIKTELATVATIAKTAAEKVAAGTTKALTLAQKGLNVAMKANPIGIVITLITALVAAFVVLWNKSDAFKQFWIKLWDGVKTATKKTIDAIGKFFSSCWEGIKKVWSFYKTFYSGVFKGIINIFKALPSKLKEFFSKAWDGAKNIWSKASSFFSGIKDKIVNAFKNIPSSIKKFFSDAWNGIKLLWSDPKKFFNTVKDKILSSFDDLPAKLKTVGSDLVKGLWNGIKDMVGWITGKLKGFSGDVLGGIKKFFGVHSPSTEMAEIGGYMAEGLAQGIEGGADDVIEAGEKIGSGFGEGFNNAAGSSVKLDDTFDKLTGTIDKQKNKLSQLEAQYKSAVMTFGATSKEAYTVGTQILTLSRELEANQLKVKDLDDAYQNLTGTLANQMRVELNNSKNELDALSKKQAEYNKQSKEALAKGDWTAARKLSEEAGKLQTEINLININVEKLTSDLDYMAKQGQKGAAKTTGEVTKEKNAYEQLLETIKNQKSQIESLKSGYESAVLTFGKYSDEANSLASQIKALSKELEDNEKQVKDLDAAFDSLSNKSAVITINVDDRNAFEKWVDRFESGMQITEKDLKKWSNSAGKYISKVGNFFEKVTSKIGEFANAINEYTSVRVENEIAAIDKVYNEFISTSDAKLERIQAEKDAELAAIEETKNAELEAIKERSEARVEMFNTAAEEELETHTAEINEQLANLNEMYDNEKISAAEYRARKRALEEEITEFKKQKEAEQLAYKQQVDAETLAEEQSLNAQLVAEKDLLEAEKQRAEQETKDAEAEANRKALEEKNRLAKKQFEAEQATSIAMAAINGAGAIVKGFAELGPIAGAVAAIVQAGLTAAQIATIASQKYVPYMAKGGVVDGATLAMIGENGKEAVMPLENNTGWITQLAEKISSIMERDMLGGIQSGIPAYAMAGGTPVINNYYYQTINSPKELTRREIYRDTKNLLALKG